MKTPFHLFVALATLVQMTSCALPASSEEYLPGKAEVVKIEDRPWIIEAGNRITDQGPVVITLRIIEPSSYQNPSRSFGVYDARELLIGDHKLQPGDIVSFRAVRGVFEQAIEPDVFANLRDIRLVPKASASPPS